MWSGWGGLIVVVGVGIGKVGGLGLVWFFLVLAGWGAGGFLVVVALARQDGLQQLQLTVAGARPADDPLPH